MRKRKVKRLRQLEQLFKDRKTLVLSPITLDNTWNRLLASAFKLAQKRAKRKLKRRQHKLTWQMAFPKIYMPKQFAIITNIG